MSLHLPLTGKLAASLLFCLSPCLLQAQHMAAAVTVPAAYPHPVQQESQKALKDALTELESRYRVYLNYEAGLVKGKFVSEAAFRGSRSLDEALRTLLTPLQLKYEKIKKNYYVIYSTEAAPASRKVGLHQEAPAGQEATREPGPAFPLLRSVPASLIQPVAVTISGRVTSNADEALPGVNILLKGTSTGTTTDAEGRYSLTVPDGSGTLVFSYIGYITEEIPIGNRTTIDVKLVADIASLNEVVVVGYGTQTRRDVTGSIASIKAEDIKNIAVTSADALLQGKAAGVQVVQNSGQPGAEVFVRVRGTASLRADSRPLYVIDGVPMNNTDRVVLDGAGQRTSALADINPNDIESIEVLKDAAATAIYGSRASNGVILITTKRGKEGKARFTFDAYQGVQQVWKKLDLLNGEQFSEMYQEAIANRNALQPNSIDVNRGGFQEAFEVTGNNTDWQDAIFRAAPISNYNMSLAGGNEKLKTFASLGYFRQQGTIIGQDYHRYNGRLNLDYQAGRNLKLGSSVTYSNSNSDRVANDFSRFSILANALLRNPNLPVRNPDGSYSVDPRGAEGTNNPVMLANEITFNTNQKRLIANMYVEYQIVQGLTFRTLLGIDNLADRTQRYVPSFVLRFDQPGEAEAQAATSDVFTWLNSNTLNYSKTFAQHHRLNALVGLELLRSRTDFLQAGGRGAGSDIIRTIAIAQPGIPSNFTTEWRLLSYLGRAGYSFKDKYLVEASFRADGSSRFGPNRRYGFFPAVSAAWRVMEEPFMQSIPLISDLKIRGGIGVTGNQEGLGNFNWQTLYGTGANYMGQPGIAQQNVPNADLGWESTTTANVGIDIAFLNNRINLTAEAYLKKTKDLLFTRQLPWTSGFSNIQNVNFGTLENRGLEFVLSTRNLDGAFRWNTDFNISLNRNKITSLPVNGSAGSDQILQLSNAYSVEGPYSIYRVGGQVGTFYGYQFLGVYAFDEDVPENLRPDNPARENYRGGYPIFVDQDGNGVYDRQLDRVVIGNALPLSTGGITNTFSFKGLELSVFLNWSYGNDIYNMTRATLISMSDDFNQSAEVLTRWRQPGDVTSIPKAMYNNSSFRAASFTDASSRYVEDGSFLRVRNATLGYNLPSSLLNRAKISSARVYVTGQNLFTFTNYSGFDPENQNTGGELIPVLGVDYLTQPQPRVYMVGLNLSF